MQLFPLLEHQITAFIGGERGEVAVVRAERAEVREHDVPFAQTWNACVETLRFALKRDPPRLVEEREIEGERLVCALKFERVPAETDVRNKREGIAALHGKAHMRGDPVQIQFVEYAQDARELQQVVAVVQQDTA